MRTVVILKLINPADGLFKRKNKYFWNTASLTDSLVILRNN